MANKWKPKKTTKNRKTRLTYSNKSSVRGWNRANENFDLAITEKRNPAEGHVYVFHLGNDLYKIGKTYNIEKRLKDLKASNPFIKCVWSTWSKRYSELEKHLHKILSTNLVEREVYRLKPKSIESINRIAMDFENVI